jgi:predicted nucleotidyltransferase
VSLNWILKVLVGSRAHGTAREDSDWDYRGVFVVPTEDLLSITRPKPSHTSWIEGGAACPGGKEDATGWEVGHFLHLALQCNPTILEVFQAPIQEMKPAPGDAGLALGLRALFPRVWDPVRVRDAFVGYGLNQRKKFLEDKDARPNKYACAYLRVLYQAWVLLTYGYLPVNLAALRHNDEGLGAEVFLKLLGWRQGAYSKGEVIDLCLRWQERVNKAAEASRKEADPARVDEYLLRLRKENWT